MSTKRSCPWLGKAPATSGGAVRLFCFPYAGGDPVSIYSKWSIYCSNELDIIPIVLPGRGTRIKEGSLDNILQIANALAKELIPFLHEPFAFFGHSMGALIAFELGRLLQEKDKFPSCIFVSGCSAPHHPKTMASNYNLPDAEFIQELRCLKGTPEEIFEEPELLSFLLPILRADFKACHTHIRQPDVRLGSPIVAFGGLTDNITKAELEDWAQYTSGHFALTMFEGDHFFIRQHYPDIIKIIRRQVQWGRIDRSGSGAGLRMMEQSKA